LDLGQIGDGCTVKRSEAYERMNPVCASEQGDGGRRKAPGLGDGNGD